MEPKDIENPVAEADFRCQLKDEQCPSCGAEYDQIDYEFQICHICGAVNH